MKKLTIAGVLVVMAAVYILLNNKDTSAVGTTPNMTSSVQNTAPAGGYKDGNYTGQIADAYYGNIQVQAAISGGKVTNVTFLQAPNDRGRSIEINQYADPMLAQEAIAAQSAQVDAVSGATATSQAFVQSLSSALSQAR